MAITAGGFPVTAPTSVGSDPRIPSARSEQDIGDGRSGRLAPLSRGWAPFAVFAVLLVDMYFRIAGKLVTDWYEIPDFSHGFLVPFFSAFLVWDRRKALGAVPVRQSWAGILLIVLALAILFVGVYGAELFSSRLSFILLLAGLIWTFLGLRMLRELWFPLAVLLLAIPLPAIVFNRITFPLQIMASEVASSVLPLLQVPVLRDGNVIQLPIMRLEVAEACSGIRSLMSLFTLSVFYGYFTERTTARRWILALASLPIAVTANVARIVGTGLCVQYWDPSKAVGFFHEFSGWVMFLVSLGCLYLVHRVMELVPLRKPVTA